MHAFALVVLALVSVATAADDALALATGDAYLARGNPRLASAQFQAVLRDHPDSGRANLGLARAYGAMGRCDEALAILATLRARPVWGADAALAEGSCHLRRGRLSDAAVAFEEAAHLGPNGPLPWVHLALVAVALGDDEAFERAATRLGALERGRVLELVVRAERALDTGDPSVDDRVRELVALGDAPTRSAVRLIDGRRWLDLDDPRAASETLRAALREEPSHVQLAVWCAESLRRSGDPLGARLTLERPLVRSGAGGPLAIALEARLLADEGALDEAAARLATHPDPTDDEALASAWYVARARADEGEASRLAARWREVVRAPDRRLEHLIPVDAREAP